MSTPTTTIMEDRKVSILANAIRVHVTKNKGVFEYEVKFFPKLDSVKVQSDLLRRIEHSIGSCRIFNGKSVFLPRKLDDSVSKQYRVSLGRGEVTITWKFVKQLEWGNCKSVFRVIFQKVMEELGLEQMKRNFYDAKSTFDLPQHRLQIWPGYIVSVNEEQGGLLLCVDVAHKLIHNDTVWDRMQAFKMADPEHWKEHFKEYVLGKIVFTNYNGVTYEVSDIDWDMTPVTSFRKRGYPEGITFAEFHSIYHKVKCQDLSQPLLLSRPRAPRMGRFRCPFTVLVPEFCYLTGLSVDGDVDMVVKKDVYQFTKLNPYQRVNALRTFIKNVHGNERAVSLLEKWGLRLDTDIVELDGRVLPSPTLVFGDGESQHVPSDFSSLAVSKKVVCPVALDSRWVIICPLQEWHFVVRFRAEFMRACHVLGIPVTVPGEIAYIESFTLEDLQITLEKQLKNSNGCKLAVVVLPSHVSEFYACVKKYTVIENVTVTQVVLAHTLRNPNITSIVVNIAMQINCKLGGASWALRWTMPNTQEKIMFLGMDVHHDPSMKSPSVMAFIATLNPECTKYFSTVDMHRPQQEVMDTLESKFTLALQQFQLMNGSPPDRVVVFRDGVGNWLLKTVIKHEVPQYLRALDNVCPQVKKKFTFMIVQKKVEERFFLQREKDDLDNLEPGTVVDRTVTRKNMRDFYVVSQNSQEATIFPVHYVVVHDESNIPLTLLQKYAYSLTYMYYNWPRAIRVPAVCQYAHKLAYLVGYHVRADPSVDLENQLYYL